MKPYRIILFVILGVALTLLAVQQGWFEKKSGDTEGPTAGEMGQVGKYSDPTLDEAQDYRNDTLRMLVKMDYDALEERVEEARKGKLKFRNGNTYLYSFYDVFSAPKQDVTTEWENLQKQPFAWLEAKPQSFAAHVAVADFYIGYAWLARGNGYADTVTEEGAKHFQDRLEKAEAILKKAAKHGIRDPHYWRVYQTVARGLEFEPEEQEAIFKKGIAVDPAYFSFYLERAVQLLPRWGGAPGQLEKFAEEAMHVPGGLGAEIYARIAEEVDGYYEHLFAIAR